MSEPTRVRDEIHDAARPKLIRPSQREYHTWNIDSTRWSHYQPRGSDIIIAAYPKCGTTWMQQIVTSLVFRSPEPRPIWRLSPWIEQRSPEPAASMAARIEAQGHRRILKSHIPLDGAPFHEGVRYIHVARDGRDAFMSLHNHFRAYTKEAIAGFDQMGAKFPEIGRPFPRLPEEASAYFRTWLTQGAVRGHTDGSPSVSFFKLETSYWEQKSRPNVLLVHFSDLKTNLATEMRRIADFLGIYVPPPIWPDLVAAAGFESMRRNGDTLLGERSHVFEGGSQRFFHKGDIGRWRGVLDEDDLELYQVKAKEFFSPGCERWVTGGRSLAGDPHE